MMASGEAGWAPQPTTGAFGIELLFFVAWSVIACAAYANSAYEITNPKDYRYFPPFEAGVNRNENDHLGGENFNIAQSLAAGNGFANPFEGRTGPTAWMPPALPGLLATLLFAFGGNRAAVVDTVVVLQVVTLVGTGILCVLLARRQGASPRLAAAVFVAALLCHFRYCFQHTHDCWLVMLGLDCLVAGWCWGLPLAARWRAMAWGFVGGLVALVSPVVGFAWVATTAIAGRRRVDRKRVGLAAAIVALVVTPWTVRNYLAFGRLIPVKSNLGYELYQSQCLLPDGVLRDTSFDSHPHRGPGVESREYRALGEVAFLDRKWDQFLASARAEPAGFPRRVGRRFFAVTLAYLPFDRDREPADRPWAYWPSLLLHPLPFISALFLLVIARRPLSIPEWVVLGVYAAYLLPYVLVGYYEWYEVPLLGVKTVLVVFAAGRLVTVLSRRPTSAAS